MATVIVTGITGRVGANMGLRLLQAGWEVRGLVQPGDPGLAKLTALPDVDVRVGDLRDLGAVTRAIDGADAVVHLAAQMARGDTPVDTFFDINALGTLRVLEGCVRASRPVERFVLASTDGTYGVTRPSYLPFDEQHPQAPGDYYDTSKVLAETLVRNHGLQYGLAWTIVRYGSVVAPDEALSLYRYHYVSRLLRQAEHGRESNLWPLFVDCQRPWQALDAAVGEAAETNPAVALHGPSGPWALHYTDVRDVVTGTVMALEHPAAACEAFNITGPSSTDFETGARIVAGALDLPVIRVDMPMQFSFGNDNRKAARILGFTPEWTFERTVHSALGYRAGHTGGVIGVGAARR
jgi:UDP-glucose 4-epimerase